MPGFFDDDDVAAAKGSGFFDAEDSAPLAPNPQAQPAAVSRITDFSPDAIAETTQQLRSDRQAKLNGIGTGTSATRGIAQGATMGFADELTGLGEGAYRAITEPDTSFGDAYTQARDESRAAYGDAQEANPMSYMAGEVGAGLATMAIPGLGAGNAARGVAGAARAAPAAVEVAGGLARTAPAVGSALARVAPEVGTALARVPGAGLATRAAPLVAETVPELIGATVNSVDAAGAVGGAARAAGIGAELGEAGTQAASIGRNIMGSPITQGAIQGGLTGAGASTGESPQDIATDTALGAAIGGGIPAAGSALGAGGRYVGRKLAEAPDKLRSMAERMAFAGLRPTAGVAKKLGAQDKINAIGRDILDNPDVPRFATSEGLSEATERAAQETGDKLNEVYQRANETLGKGGGNVSKEDLLQGLARQALRRGAEDFSRPAETAAMRDVMRRLNTVRSNDLSLNQLRKLRGKIQKLAQPNKLGDQTEKQAAMMSIAGDLNTVIGTKIDEAARALGETGHTTGSTGLKSLNRQFHLRQTAADIVGDRVNKDAALRLLSPSTYGTGLVTGGFAGADDFRQGNYASGLGKAAVGFAAGAVGNNLIKNREKMIAARSLDVLSRGIKKVDMTKNLIKSATTGRLAQTRFGGAIMQAAQSGDRGKIAATNYVLSEQFPEYRQAKDADEEEQEMSHE